MMIKELIYRFALLPIIVIASLAAAPLPEKPTHFAKNGGWFIDRFETHCTAFAFAASDRVIILKAHEGAEWFYVALANKRWKSIVDDSDMTFVATFSLKGREIATQTINAKGLNADIFGFEFYADNEAGRDGFSIVGLFLSADFMSLQRNGVPIVDVSLKDSNAAILSLMKCHAEVQKRSGFDPFVLK